MIDRKPGSYLAISEVLFRGTYTCGQPVMAVLLADGEAALTHDGVACDLFVQSEANEYLRYLERGAPN